MLYPADPADDKKGKGTGTGERCCLPEDRLCFYFTEARCSPFPEMPAVAV